MDKRTAFKNARMYFRKFWAPVVVYFDPDTGKFDYARESTFERWESLGVVDSSWVVGVVD